MPWSHCEVDFILDTEDCPTCGVTKAEWTIQVDTTRTFVIPKKKQVAAELVVEDAREAAATLIIEHAPQPHLGASLAVGQGSTRSVHVRVS